MPNVHRHLTDLVLVLPLLLATACDDSPAARPDIGASDLPPSHDAAPGADIAPADAPATDTHKAPELNECNTMQKDWIFCSSFEEGDKSIWDDYDGNPDSTNLLLADPGPFSLSGNHVMRLRVPPGRGGADLVKLLPGQHQRLYARWYIQWESGYDFSAANHGGGLHAGDRNYLGRSDYRPTGADWYSAWVEPLPSNKRLNLYSYYRGMYQDCANPSGACWGDHFPCMAGSNYCTDPAHLPTVTPPVMQSGKWYCIEMMLDGGTAVTDASKADGQLDFWIDGQQIGPWTKLWLRTDAKVQVNILWLNLFHHAEHSVEGVIYDNVVVSTARVGCL